MKAPRRVLLLEDDPSICRFVDMALTGLPIELVEAMSIAQAREQLAQQEFDLFISDLMLPDGNAMEMFRTLRADRPGSTMRIVVFSAGVSAAARELAAELGVFRVLDKPVPYRELVACVEQALGTAEPLPVEPAVALAHSLPATQRQRAIDDHFGGQAALFDEFFASCLAQLRPTSKPGTGPARRTTPARCVGWRTTSSRSCNSSAAQKGMRWHASWNTRPPRASPFRRWPPAGVAFARM